MNNYRSEQINELATALSKAQAEFKIAVLNKNNPFFKSKYADYTAIVEAARPSLSKYGFSVSQSILTDQEGKDFLHTILLHSSGQFLESRMKINPVKSDIQSVSSYITYIKRVTFASLVGVLTGEEDDDGEAAMVHERQPASRQYNPTPTSIYLTPEQVAHINRKLDGDTETGSDILKAFKVEELSQIPAKYYDTILDTIQKRK